MALEIELKARVDSPEKLKLTLSSLGTAVCSYEKEDVYYHTAANGAVTADPLPASGLRIRQEKSENSKTGEHSEITLITYKIRQNPGEDGIEVNNEKEFTVSEASVFSDLIHRLGLVPEIRKHKTGWAWNCMGSDNAVIRAELSLVRDLGWFIELEILESEDCALQEQKISERRKSLLELLEKLGIPMEKIEKRPYTVMLRSLQGSL